MNIHNLHKMMSIAMSAIVVFFCGSAAKTRFRSTTQQDSPEISINVSPSEVHEGLTTDLDLNCTFQANQGSQFDVLLSLIVSKLSADDKYIELAAITFRSQGAMVHNNLGANVTGQVDSDSYYLGFKWHYPRDDVIGQYKCEAHGMDRSGHCLVAMATAVIREKDVDHDVLLAKIKTLETSFNKYKTETQSLLEKQSIQLVDQRKENDDLRSKLISLTTTLSQLKTTIDRPKLSFESNFTCDDHDYLLSKPIPNVSFMDRDLSCQILGGYLAEVNDKREDDCIREFLKHYIMDGGSDWIYIAGSDSGSEGRWMYHRTGLRMRYRNWYVGNPDNGGDCVHLYQVYDYKMGDVPCVKTFPTRFICEIP